MSDSPNTSVSSLPADPTPNSQHNSIMELSIPPPSAEPSVTLTLPVPHITNLQLHARAYNFIHDRSSNGWWV